MKRTLTRALVTGAATAGLVLGGAGIASADPCGTDCGTDAPYGINTTMQQKLSGQKASGSAKTRNAFESAADAIGRQLGDLFG